MRRIISIKSLSVGVSALAVALAFPGVAQAQVEQSQQEAAPAQDDSEATTLPESGAPSDEDIVVTGSRIPRPNFDTLQPAIVVDSAQIESRGFETLGQALNELPSFGVPGASPVGAAQGGSFGSGQSFINFLGLGDQRTLTLINGRRFVSSNTASIFGPTNAGSQVDLNGINTKLVERIETIAIGGAPVYGSDAIAGTVNVILKRDFEGIEVDGQYGISDEGDGQNYRIRAIAGHNFADGRGNIVISGEYNKGSGLVYNDRPVTALSAFYGDCPADLPFNQCYYPNRRIASISESGIPLVGGDVLGLDFPLTPAQSDALLAGSGLDYAGPFNPGVLNGGGQYLQFDAAGNLIPIDFGQPVGTPDDFNLDSSGGNGFNLINTQQLLTDTKRYNANILGNFELTDNIRLFGEAWYSYSKGTNLREQPVYNTGVFDAAGTPDGNIILSVNNPFLTPAQRATIQNSIDTNPYSDENYFPFLFGPGAAFEQDYFYYGRANTDLISGRASSKTEVYRLVGGVDGTFEVLPGKQWVFELVGNYGKSETEGREPTIVQQNFLNAVGAITADNPEGIPCLAGLPSAPIGTLNSTCTPLNLFGSNVLDPAARDYVTAIATPRGENEQWVITASVGGGLFSLPGGDFSFALGYEHRDESTAFDPGAVFFGGPDPDPTTDTNNDGIPDNDRVGFGRSVPILPVSGGFNTDEVFGELRAPIIGPSNNVPGVYSLELHGALRYVDNSAAGTDPTYTIEGRYAPIQDIAIRANYTRAIRAPAITELFNPSSSFFGFATDPCDADNLEAGPDPATRAANCAADGLPDDFQSLSAQRSFDQALAGNVALENEKSEAWSVGVIFTPTFIRGLTISADWLDIRLKDAITSFSGTQVVNGCYDSTDFPGNEFCDRVQRDEDGELSFIETSFFNAAEFRYKGLLGALDYRIDTPFLGAESKVGVNLSYQYLDSLTQRADENSAPTTLSGSIGYPKHSGVLNLNYRGKKFGLFTSINYTGKVELDPDVPDDFYQFQDVDAVAYVNVGADFDIDERFTFRIVVDNVFDGDVPFPVPALGGAVTYFPGILGRYFRAGATVRF